MGWDWRVGRLNCKSWNQFHETIIRQRFSGDFRYFFVKFYENHVVLCCWFRLLLLLLHVCLCLFVGSVFYLILCNYEYYIFLIYSHLCVYFDLRFYKYHIIRKVVSFRKIHISINISAQRYRRRCSFTYDV